MNKIISQNKKLKILVPVSLILFALTIVFVWFASRYYVINKAQKDIESMLLQHKGVHQYVQKKSIPELYNLKEQKRIPEELYSPILFSSSYMVRNMHDLYNKEREKVGLPYLYYKMAAINPRNPVNKANEFERSLIELFNKNTDLKHYESIEDIDGQKYLYVAVPFLRNTEQCLKCHGKYEDAPPQLQALYPEKGGFNEKIGYLRAIESLRAPLRGQLKISNIILISATIVCLIIFSLVYLNQKLSTMAFERAGVIQDQANKIRKNEEDLRITLNSLGEGVIAVDNLDHIVRMNPVAEKLTGWKLTESEGVLVHNILKFKEEPKKESIETSQNTLIDSNKTGKLTKCVIISKNGTEYKISYSTSPIRNDQEETVGYVMILRDITAQVEMERQLYQSQKMESIGRLAGGVAHDFNNILSVITGNTDLAYIKMENGENIAEELDEISKASNRSSNLVKQLLAFGRREIAEPKNINLNELVYSMLRMLEKLIGEDIELKFIPGNDLPMIYIDPVQMEQILLNLCINARDAIDNVGIITIDTSSLKLDDPYFDFGKDFEPGTFVKLTVSDNGCGIDKQTLDRIFEPFFSTKKEDRGTGLGLATVYGIVSQNNGQIHVYSELDTGTTFNLYFPEAINSTSPVKETTVEEKNINYSGKTVLLVEDDLQNLRVTSSILEHLGVTVLKASTPGQALEIFKTEHSRIDLLLTDVILPEMNGKQLYESIKLEKPQLKCLYMSGYTADVISSRAFLEKNIHFIQKPFTINMLREKLNTITF